MRANGVVPMAKDEEVVVEVRYDSIPLPRSLSRLREREVYELIQLLFERAEQAFYPAVLPGAAGRGALVADAVLFEASLECTRMAKKST